MRAALFLENNKLCSIADDVEQRNLRVIVFGRDENFNICMSDEYLENPSVGYLMLWLYSSRIHKIFVKDVDEKLKPMLDEIDVTVRVKKELENEPLLIGVSY
ncbi:hypothetical protein [Bacteroides sp. 224]|uniref:hypothetical protein n=1 Tax=Bacteroides sp. 224 TaxID=2302936 RepID=UPI0013D56B91|nr:hypothetical protein [Bacteroides sp. 224]NDV64372.1 hypothetical protein [Bacteroides sp. 224]